jgi:hypothetical protein
MAASVDRLGCPLESDTVWASRRLVLGRPLKKGDGLIAFGPGDTLDAGSVLTRDRGVALAHALGVQAHALAVHAIRHSGDHDRHAGLSVEEDAAEFVGLVKLDAEGGHVAAPSQAHASHDPHTAQVGCTSFGSALRQAAQAVVSHWAAPLCSGDRCWTSPLGTRRQQTSQYVQTQPQGARSVS